jgi:alpha-D-xyloside xylohydrolase
MMRISYFIVEEGVLLMADQVPLLPYNIYMAEPPHLPVRQADDDGGPDFLIEAEVKDLHAQGVVLQGKTCSGARLSVAITLIADGMARVCLEDEASDQARLRLAHDFPPFEHGVTIEQSENSICLRTTALKVVIDLRPFHISYYGADGNFPA